MQKSFKRPGREKEKSEFDSNILDLARVTRVTEGGKHMSFRALVVVGDRKGRVGFGVEKGKDVQIGVDKATRQAKKNLIKVPMVNETIPHAVYMKFKAAKVMLKPAPRGSGIIAGGAVRVVLDLAGVPNVSSKIIGKTKNKITIIKATFEALKALRVSTPKNMVKRVVAPVSVSEVKEEIKQEEKVSADKTNKTKK